MSKINGKGVRRGMKLTDLDKPKEYIDFSRIGLGEACLFGNSIYIKISEVWMEDNALVFEHETPYKGRLIKLNPVTRVKPLNLKELTYETK